MKKSGIPGYEDEDEETQKKELQRIMRNVFSTEEGKIALNVLLTDLHYFDLCTNEGQAALSNYAKILITERLGIVNTINITNAMIETDKE